MTEYTLKEMHFEGTLPSNHLVTQRFFDISLRVLVYVVSVLPINRILNASSSFSLSPNPPSSFPDFLFYREGSPVDQGSGPHGFGSLGHSPPSSRTLEGGSNFLIL